MTSSPPAPFPLRGRGGWGYSVRPMKISQLFSYWAFLAEEEALLGGEVEELSSHDHFKASFGMMFGQRFFGDLLRNWFGTIDHFPHLPSFALSLKNSVCPSSGRI
jgi:hypothetical protein